MIIAIDGPAGAGKSTIAKRVAKKLGFLYIDTGAMYRALTLKVLEQKLDIQDASAITALAKDTSIELVNDHETGLKVFLDRVDVSRSIRQPVVTKFVSDIAKIKGVREVMLRLQRKMGQAVDVVLDGRDIGTVVFPEADKKFYLDADFSERVNRRYIELKGLGEDVTPAGIEADLMNRDTIDSNREFAPLKKADDAVLVDTSDMAIDEVVAEVLGRIKNE